MTPAQAKQRQARGEEERQREGEDGEVQLQEPPQCERCVGCLDRVGCQRCPTVNRREAGPGGHLGSSVGTRSATTARDFVTTLWQVPRAARALHRARDRARPGTLPRPAGRTAYRQPARSSSRAASSAERLAVDAARSSPRRRRPRRGCGPRAGSRRPQAERVARAVGALVVGEHPGAEVGELRPREQLGADLGVRRISASPRRRAGRASPARSGDSDLAHVVEHARSAHALDAVRRQAQLARPSSARSGPRSASAAVPVSRMSSASARPTTVASCSPRAR